MPEHTPGTWEVRGPFSDAIEGTATYEISRAEGPYWIALALRVEDAGLICAAPDLLKALKRIVSVADTTVGEVVRFGHPYFDEARAAIAKATGK